MAFPVPDMSVGVDASATNTTRWAKATRIRPSGHLLSVAVQPGDGATLDGRYRLVTLLKTGGMGEIYAAEHIHTQRRVAVKILREPWCRDQVTHERFRREAQAVARFKSADLAFQKSRAPWRFRHRLLPRASVGPPVMTPMATVHPRSGSRL